MAADRQEARSAAQDQYGTVEQYEATLDSLEHILFGDVQKRSRDELENRAAQAICAWNERPA